MNGGGEIVRTFREQTAIALMLMASACSFSGCAGAAQSTMERAPATHATDATAIAAQSIIDSALQATATSASDVTPAPPASTAPTSPPTPAPPATPSPTATPDVAATEQALAAAVATALAATQAAQPTATPNLAATATAQGHTIETAIAATLTAQPTASLNLAATRAAQTARLETAVAATLTAQPRPTATRPATPTAAPQPRAGNFRACLEPCAANGANARWSLPEAVTKVYVAYDFSGIPAGAHYQRIWRVVGRGEWVRYDCIWPGPTDGTVEVTLTEPNGLYSGEWEMSIVVDGAVLLQEQFLVEGSWQAWYPAGVISTCFGKVSTR